MNVVYTDLELEDLCALEFLGRKYAERSSEFAIVASGVGMFSTELQGERAVRKILPNCLFAYVGDWDVSAHCSSIKRMYCMSNLNYFAEELAKVPVCKQIYVIMGDEYGEFGWKPALEEEVSCEAYKYITYRISEYSLQVTHPELEARFKLLRFNGISRLKYYEQYEKEVSIYCPKLEFLLLVESKQGFMFHLFSESEFVVRDSTKKFLSKDRVDRYNQFFSMYKQRCQVYVGICRILQCMQHDYVYKQLDRAEQIRMNAAAFIFMYSNGMPSETSVCIAERMLNDWSLQAFTPFVTWILTHVNDFRFLKRDAGIKDLEECVWMAVHYMDKCVPKYVYRSIAHFKVAGQFPNLNGYVMSLDDYRSWEGNIRCVKNVPSREDYQKLFIIMRAEARSANNVQEDGKNVFISEFAVNYIDELEKKVLTAYDNVMLNEMQSSIF